MGSLAALLIFAGSYAGAITPQEHHRCLDAADDGAESCHAAAIDAADRADALAAQNASGAGNDSLNQASHREAGVTQAIAALLGGARAKCEAQAKRCSDACTGDYAPIGTACGKDIGKYIEQLSEGFGENQSGHQGSTRSASFSAQDSGGGPGSEPPHSDPSHPAAGAAAPASEAKWNNHDPLLQAPRSGASSEPRHSSHETGTNADTLQRNVAAVDRGGYNGGGSGYRDASGGGSRGSDWSGADGSQSQHGSRLSALRATLQGEQLQAAILKYCASVGSTDQECGGILSANFCSSPARAACPSCRQLSPDQLEAGELAAACSGACARDPGYADSLADKCRSLRIAGLEGASRDPAQTDPNEIGGRFGLSIFKVISSTIERHCLAGKLRCGH